MFDRVLIGVDGHDGGRDAIALAKVLAPGRAQLILGYVYPSEAYVWRGGTPAYAPMEHDEALTVLEQARREAGVQADLGLIGCPSIARGLHELAQERGADALVLGSSRRGVLGTLILGDDTRAVLHDAHCPVAVAPIGYAGEVHPIGEVGVAYNGSGESETALAVARRLAAQHHAKLSAFEAVALPAASYMSGATPPPEVYDDMVRDAKARVSALDGVEAHAVYGQAAEELALYSGSVDLLVIGSRDLGFLGRLVRRSVTRQLARSARCPMVVIRGSDQGAGRDL